MKLLAIRSFDVADPLPGLGKKVEPAAPAKPAPVPSPTGRQGVFQGPDGKLHTAIPENEKSQMPSPYGFGPTAEALLRLREGDFSKLEDCVLAWNHVVDGYVARTQELFSEAPTSVWNYARLETCGGKTVAQETKIAKAKPKKVCRPAPLVLDDVQYPPRTATEVLAEQQKRDAITAFYVDRRPSAKLRSK